MEKKKRKTNGLSDVFNAGLAAVFGCCIHSLFSDVVFVPWQHDRAAWLACPKDPLVDTVAENLLDRLEVLVYFRTQVLLWPIHKKLLIIANCFSSFCSCIKEKETFKKKVA